MIKCIIEKFKTLFNAQDKDQNVRVLSIEELTDKLKTPVWIETKIFDVYCNWAIVYGYGSKNKESRLPEGWESYTFGMAYPVGRLVWWNPDDYGKTWRCWTKCPTEEQRKAVKWE